jgi:alanyl-tRNA synthetase
MYFKKPEIENAKVKNYIYKNNRHFVELEPNPFYEDGAGGQIGDRGFIGEASVLYVSDMIEVDRSLEINSDVKITIDMKRRSEIARQHTAQHIISAAIEKMYGAKTVGFHMGEEDTTIDLDKPFDIEKIEEFSNEIVFSNFGVEEMIVSPDEALKYDLRKDLSEKALKSGNIRLIKIDSFDLNACGGFHVSSTGEIGIIKITHSERVKGGLVRIWFVAGFRALRDYTLRSKMINESAKLFDASWIDLKLRIQKCLEESKEKNSLLKRLSEEIAVYASRELKPAQIVDLDESVASFLTRSKQDIPYVIRINGTNNLILCLPGYDRAKILDIARSVGAKGGGNGPIYRFSTDNFDKFANELKKLIS